MHGLRFCSRLTPVSATLHLELRLCCFTMACFDANRPISELQTSSITVTIKRPTENRLIKTIKISMFMNVSTEKFVVDKVFIDLCQQNTSCVICNTHSCKNAFQSLHEKESCKYFIYPILCKSTKFSLTFKHTLYSHACCQQVEEV